MRFFQTKRRRVRADRRRSDLRPIDRKSLHRRSVLRGSGVAMSLPWLQQMGDNAVSAGENAMEDADASLGDRDGVARPLDRPPVRSAFLFMPNGVYPKHWTPPQIAGSDRFELTPMLRPLKNVADEVILLENFRHPDLAGGNGHWPKVPAFLSGGYVQRTSGRDLSTGNRSADQLMASEIGAATPLPSLELGVDAAYTGVDNVGGGFARIYGSHIAWRDPSTPVPKEIVPQLAFDRLFRTKTPPVLSGLTPNQKAVVESLRRDETSILDLVRQDAVDLQRQLGVDDRAKLDEYLESVRSIEKRIESSLRPQRRWINEKPMELSRPGVGIPERHVDHVRLMMDIMVLAFWTDTTRVSTYMLGNAQTGRNFSFIDGVKGSFHGLSHHQNEPSKIKQYEAIGTWHIEQLAYLIDRMRSLKEGDGTLLDHSMVFFGSTLRDGQRHETHNLPLLWAGRGGGGIRTGRRLTAPEDTPLCNVYLAMMRRMGIEIDQFNTSTEGLDFA